MKRYAVFLFESYDAGGGWHDYVGSADSVEEAKAGITVRRYTTSSGSEMGQLYWQNKRYGSHATCYQIVDLTEGTVVEEGYEQYEGFADYQGEGG